MLAAFEAPARRAGMTLVQGKGSDTDTLGAKTVLVPPAAVGPQPIAAGLNPKARRRVSARRRARGARGADHARAGVGRCTTRRCFRSTRRRCTTSSMTT